MSPSNDVVSCILGRPSLALAPPRALVVMGPAGAGKTRIGRRVAELRGAHFVDADDHHDEEAIARMTRGEPLDDPLRAPWLARLRALLDAATIEHPVVLACSALKESYRAILGAPRVDVGLVYLRVPRAELERRLRTRRDHFAGPALVDSQLSTLEEPEDALVLDGTAAPEELARCVDAFWPNL